MVPEILNELMGNSGPLITIAESLWALEPTAADSLRKRMAAGTKMDMASPTVVTDNDVAVVSVRGTFSPSGWGDVNTNALIETLEDLAVDDSVQAILLDINSPGGAAARLADAADAVRQANSIKPVVAQIDGLGASAAYYLAANASRIYASSRSDMVGSIGTRLQLVETKGLFDKLGMRAVTVDTGDFKSAGAGGTEITPAQEAYFQGIVDQMQEGFTQTVSTGRGLSGAALTAVTDGRIHLAEHAEALGLIDGIQPAVKTLASMASSRSGESTMSQDTTPAAPQAATFEDLKLIPGADSDFVVEALEAGWTLDQAQSTWMERQHAAVADALREARDARAEADKLKVQAQVPSATDLDLVDKASSGEPAEPAPTNAIEAWEKIVASYVAGGMSKADATAEAAREHEDARWAYLQAYRDLHGTAEEARTRSLGRSKRSVK